MNAPPNPRGPLQPEEALDSRGMELAAMVGVLLCMVVGTILNMSTSVPPRSSKEIEDKIIRILGPPNGVSNEDFGG